MELGEDVRALMWQALDASRGEPGTRATGLVGFNLEAPAKVIYPQTTPLVNLLPRRKGAGMDLAYWKAVTDASPGRGGEPAAYQLTAMQTAFTVIASAGPVAEYVEMKPAASADLSPIEPPVDVSDSLFLPVHFARLLYRTKEQEERYVLGELLRQTGEEGTVATYDAAFALADCDLLLMRMHVEHGADPDFLLMSSAMRDLLSGLCIAAGQTNQERPVFAVDGAVVRSAPPRDATITHFDNLATGKTLPIIPHADMPDGAILAFSVTWPVEMPPVTSAWSPEPQPFGAPIEIEVNQEYMGLQFAGDTPLDERCDVLVEIALKVRWIGGCGLLRAAS